MFNELHWAQSYVRRWYSCISSINYQNFIKHFWRVTQHDLVEICRRFGRIVREFYIPPKVEYRVYKNGHSILTYACLVHMTFSHPVYWLYISCQPHTSLTFTSNFLVAVYMLTTCFDLLNQGDIINSSTDWAGSRNEDWEVFIEFKCQRKSYLSGGVCVLILYRGWQSIIPRWQAEITL